MKTLPTIFAFILMISLLPATSQGHSVPQKKVIELCQSHPNRDDILYVTSYRAELDIKYYTIQMTLMRAACQQGQPVFALPTDAHFVAITDADFTVPAGEGAGEANLATIPLVKSKNQNGQLHITAQFPHNNLYPRGLQKRNFTLTVGFWQSWYFNLVIPEL